MRKKLTKLNAINTMLLDIGEAPIDDLSEIDGIWEAQRASNMLDSVLLEVLNKGYTFNVQTVTLEPANDGTITLDDTILQVTDNPVVVERGDQLFNQITNTNIFDKAVTVKVSVWIDYDDCPFPVQRYVVARASRRFMKNSLGSDTLNKQLAEEEQSAQVELEIWEARDTKYNLLTNSDFYNSISRNKRRT